MDVTNDLINKTKKLKTPFAVYDLDIISKNITNIRGALPNVDIFYSLKCNPLQTLVKRIYKEGAGFEIASLAEAEQLIKYRVKPERMMCLHPIKSTEFLSYLVKNKIEVLAVDSYEEVNKIAQFAPGSKVVARLDVPNTGSVWDLSGKFGINPSEFPRFFRYIKSKKLIPHGITIHVGSQCESLAAWERALEICSRVWELAEKDKMQLKLLSLGGGLPAQYTRPVPTLVEIGNTINRKLNELFIQKYPNIQVTIEPGRAIVATSAMMGTKIFGIAKREGTMWAYIETGTHNGLMEAFETKDPNFYPIHVEHRNRKKIRYNIGGPSCMTIDTVFQNIQLPELKLGERMYIKNTGAYSVTCSGPFNGFPVPEVYFINSNKDVNDNLGHKN